MNTNCTYEQFMAYVNSVDSFGPEVEFEDGYTTEDFWNKDCTDVIGFIRYHDGGKVEYVLTGRK